MENYQPIHFFDDPIQPIFDSPPAREKTPNCPDGFIWNERTFRVTEMLSSWSDFARRGKMARNMRPAHAAVAAGRGSLNEKVLDDEGRKNVLEQGRQIVEEFIWKLTGDVTIVSGGAKGVDSWAAEAARDRGFRVVEIKPNWKKYGRGAGFKRNTEIVEAADAAVVFWNKTSRGTFDTIKKTMKAEKDIMVFGPDGRLYFWATQEDYRDEPSLLEVMIAKKRLVVPDYVKEKEGIE